jgi:hypothetical protein
MVFLILFSLVLFDLVGFLFNGRFECMSRLDYVGIFTRSTMLTIFQ